MNNLRAKPQNPRPTPIFRFPRDVFHIHISDDIDIEITTEQVRVWGAAFVGSSTQYGRQVYQPPSVSHRPLVNQRQDRSQAYERLVVSNRASEFMLIYGRIKVVIDPENRVVEVWNARYVDVMLPDQASVRLCDKPLAEPDFDETALLKAPDEGSS